jgi:cysteine desulfurase / selenocysteine lyase
MNIKDIKKDFPILDRKINNHRLVYLDNAATTQKPLPVVEAISSYYLTNNANIHRGLHTLSEEASEMYENSRENISKFFGTSSTDEIIFTSGTTESVNLIAFGWGEKNINSHDEILILLSEHHSNFVPWQEIAKRKKANLIVENLQSDFSYNFNEMFKKITSKTKIMVLSHASNVLGNILDIKTIIHKAKKINPELVFMVDGAQAAPHMEINLKSLDCDFYVMSGHKLLGPTGVGILYIKKEIQNKVDPIKFGGGMIKEVYLDSTTLKNSCEKYEGGTPNIAGVIGMGVAINYLRNIGMSNVQNHSMKLLDYFFEKASEYSDLEIYGEKNSQNRCGLVSFNIQGIHPHDVAAVLANQGVAVRSGHHCAMPLHKHLQIPGSVRASFYIYNDFEDIDDLFKALDKAKKILKS